jgi:DNA-binding transcriptional LysR family regulator
MMMHHELDLSVLRTFVAIVETGGLTSAGRRVGRTQPAVSHQAKRLEESVGRPLFESDKRHLTLTPDGEILLEYARSMLRLNDEVRARFDRPAVEGHVTLGTPDLYAAYLLPGLLGSFARAYPGIEIELRCQRSVYLMSALQSEVVDIAIITRQPDLQTGDVVRREPLVWVASGTARPELEPVLPLALLPPGSVYRQQALEALGAVGRRWAVASFSDSIAGLQAAVFAGLAVAVMPLCAVSPAMRRLGAAEGLPSLPAVDLVMVRKLANLSPAAAQLADYISHRIDAVEAFRSFEQTADR